MTYILDTNIVLAYLRAQNNSEAALRQTQMINAQLNLFSGVHKLSISVVIKGELLSIGYRNGWGKAQDLRLQTLLSRFIIFDIFESDLKLQLAYAEIDAFSQGKHKTHSLNRSSVNMGKNDLWIAASTHSLGAELVTFDKDFLHLDGVFFKVHCFPV